MKGVFFFNKLVMGMVISVKAGAMTCSILTVLISDVLYPCFWWVLGSLSPQASLVVVLIHQLIFYVLNNAIVSAINFGTCFFTF